MAARTAAAQPARRLMFEGHLLPARVSVSDPEGMRLVANKVRRAVASVCQSEGCSGRAGVGTDRWSSRPQDCEGVAHKGACSRCGDTNVQYMHGTT